MEQPNPAYLQELKKKYTEYSAHLGDVTYRHKMLEVEQAELMKKINDIEIEIFKLKNPEAKQHAPKEPDLGGNGMG